MFQRTRMAAIATLITAMIAFAPGGVVEASSSSASTIESMFFSEMLVEGDVVELLTNGPFTISATCSTIDSEANARLLMTVTADSEDEWVYGYPDFRPQDYYNTCIGTTTAGTTSDTCIVWSVGAGNYDHVGAFSTLSGYYVGFGGDSTIGFNKDYLLNDPSLMEYGYHAYTAADLAAFPSEYNCVISGELTYKS